MSGTAGDGTAALAAALAPKGGMKPIPLTTESYEHPSKALASKRLLNLYAEQQPSDARHPFALVPTPGLMPWEFVGVGPIKAINTELPGRVYTVSGSGFYRKSNGEAPEYMGEIGEPDVVDGPVKTVTVAVGPTACVVCVPPRAYTCGHSGPMRQITADFEGAQAVAYLDGYFVFVSAENSARFFVTGLLDPSRIDALDFAYSDAIPNVIRMCKTLSGQVWMMGEAGIEIWQNVGAADFPLRRVDGGVIPYGVASVRSVASGDGSMFFMGQDGIVYRTAGYQAKRISTHAMEAIIASIGAAGATDGLVYSQRGHTFYAFSLGERTFVYDCATRLWHERSSSSDGAARWRASCAARAGSLQLIGDRMSGAVFTPSLGSSYDFNDLLLRIATCPPLFANSNRAFMHRLELELETGGTEPGTILLEISDDGGNTWPRSRTLTSGAVNEFRHRAYTTALGSFRQRMLRFSARGRTTLYGLFADMTTGDGG